VTSPLIHKFGLYSCQLYRLQVARDVVLKRYPDYWRITDEIHVRIKQLPIIDSLRDLRHMHLNAFVKVSGVVTRRTGVYPMLKRMHYTCTKCGCDIGPFYLHDEKEVRM
jgi:DNA replication licensing factor MCM2